MQKRWVHKPFDPTKVERLHSELKIDRLLCQLLVQRGIETFDQAKTFFRPSMEDLHDPFLMKGMEDAVNRVTEAISGGQKILIFGDYDVDGTTAISLVYSFFHEIHSNITYYVPDRYKEGYGISKAGIEHAHQNSVGLIIALDCGITAIEEIEMANDFGIDVIICDHHLPGDHLPNAHAILDPKQQDCLYPYKELSGCGIGFKLCQAFALQNDLSVRSFQQLLDIVAVSIGSDIVPITGENRVLAHFGMVQLNTDPHPGLKALLQSANKTGELSITDVVFTLGPRINAAGRMGDAREVLRMMLAENDEEAMIQAQKLEKHNMDRKEVDKVITEQALDKLRSEAEDKCTTVVFDPSWHKGVIGIVASRLIESFHRPTIVLTQSNGLVTGSARSVQGFNIYKALKSCSHLLTAFGGHEHAAGLSLKPADLEEFKMSFEKVVQESIDPALLVPEVEVDAEIELTNVDYSFYNILKQFAPFGPGNLQPIFLSKGMMVEERSRVVGENHLKIYTKQNGSRTFDAIAFRQSDKLNLIRSSPTQMVYHIDENEFRGIRCLQLNVIDIKPMTDDPAS